MTEFEQTVLQQLSAISADLARLRCANGSAIGGDPGPAPEVPKFSDAADDPMKDADGNSFGRVRLHIIDVLHARWPQVSFPGEWAYIVPAWREGLARRTQERIEVNTGGADFPGTANRAFMYPNAPTSWERGDTLPLTLSFSEKTIEEVEACVLAMFAARLNDHAPPADLPFSPGG